MSITDDAQLLKQRYESIALSLDDKTTASDYLLRELEIDLGAQYMHPGQQVLDVGCGLGYALRQYAQRCKVSGVGLDYAENMVKSARQRVADTMPGAPIEFVHGSVADMPLDSGRFDVVTSHRCLMALLDWDLQRAALRDLHRVLKPGGILVLMEGTLDGLERLNYYRRLFGLAEIEADGRDRLLTRKFREKELLEEAGQGFELMRTQRFGMYYFLTRIVQPLFVAPEAPRYDHKLNEIAHRIAKAIPDLDGIGHLVGFVLRKR